MSSVMRYYVFEFLIFRILSANTTELTMLKYTLISLFSGTSDPYVKFKVGGRLLYKSKTIYRELNPIWDEIFTLPIEDPFMPVHIKVRIPNLISSTDS